MLWQVAWAWCFVCRWLLGETVLDHAWFRSNLLWQQLVISTCLRGPRYLRAFSFTDSKSSMWFSVGHFQFLVQLHQHQTRCLHPYRLLLDLRRLSSVMLHLTFRMTIWMQEHLKLWILAYQSLSSWTLLHYLAAFSRDLSYCPLLLVVLRLSHLLFYDAPMTLMRSRWPHQPWCPCAPMPSILFWRLFLTQLQQLGQYPATSAHLLPGWPWFVECWCIAWTRHYMSYYLLWALTLHSPCFG